MRGGGGLNVLLLGSDQFTSPHLRRLYQMLGKGRLGGLELMTSSEGRCEARATARELSVPVHAWREDFEFARFDLGVVASFGRFIPREVISKWRHGAINVHPSLLPRWRGSAPVLYAILAGDAATGVSITEVSPDGFDRGAVLLQRRLPLVGDEDTPGLLAALARLGCDCLETTLEDLPGTRRAGVAQADLPYKRSLARRPDPSFACLDWDRMDAAAVDRAVRGLGHLGPLRCRLDFGSSRMPGGHLQVPLALSGHLPPAERDSAQPRDPPDAPGQLHFDPLTPACNAAVFVGCAGGGWAGFRWLTRAGHPRLSPVEFHNGYLAGRGRWARLLGLRNGFFSGRPAAAWAAATAAVRSPL